jgi:hypothetical protein
MKFLSSEWNNRYSRGAVERGFQNPTAIPMNARAVEPIAKLGEGGQFVLGERGS